MTAAECDGTCAFCVCQPEEGMCFVDLVPIGDDDDGFIW